jgi:formate-dependent nitrite reductase membrane component NrfD
MLVAPGLGRLDTELLRLECPWSALLKGFSGTTSWLSCGMLLLVKFVLLLLLLLLLVLLLLTDILEPEDRKLVFKVLAGCRLLKLRAKLFIT